MSKVEARAVPAQAGWWWRLTYAIGPDLLFLSIFASLLAVLMVSYQGHFTFIQSSIILPLVILSILVGVAFAGRARAILSGDPEARQEFVRVTGEMVRDWLPLVLCVTVYENFHDLTDLIRPDVVDDTLRRYDELLLGVEPTLWLQNHMNPWLTEYMTFCYALYFFYPVGILTALYRNNDFVQFREFGLALTLTFYLGLTGYMLVPAIGPRYFMANEFLLPLEGIWLTDRAAAAWNALQTIKRDCFPSLHTGLTTVSLIYMWRFRNVWKRGKLALWVCAPLIVSLWCSTIYLRYHYFVDVIAGWLLAISCSRIAPAFIRWYYARKLGQEPVVSTSVARR